MLKTFAVFVTAKAKTSLGFINEHGIDIAKDAYDRAKTFASDVSTQADLRNEAKALARRNKEASEFYSKYGADIAHGGAGSQSQTSQFDDECNIMIDPNAHDHS